MKTWFISTKHLENGLWFKDDDDFRKGMNGVAVLVAAMHISILAFILMSNHVHFVLACSRNEAEDFISRFKCAYSRYLQKKYGVKEFLRGNEVCISEVETYQESLERVIAYVQMNCVVSNICQSPILYPWGTGRSFFDATSQNGTRIGDISNNKRFVMLRSKTIIPGDWLIKDGYIVPESYVRVRYVESLFKTPKRYLFFLNNSAKAKKRSEMGENSGPSFKDQSILAALPDLCKSLFQKSSVKELDEAQKGEFLRQIRYRFSANVHQIARVTGLSYAESARLLNTFS